MVIRFDVTKEDIAASRKLLRNKGRNETELMAMCPVSLAARRQGYPQWITGERFVQPWIFGPSYSPPKKCADFVRAFDGFFPAGTRKPVAKPFRFKLTLRGKGGDV